MTKRKVCVVGNYKFTGKVLGRGNFAKVEEACHELLGIKVAVKIMDLNNIKEDYVLRNLFREARIMSKLKHPCIVSLFETMQRNDNSYYIVTEIINGGDLCTYVKGQRGGKLDEKSTKVFAQQFVSAISHMHQRGIVHRDLKMENVMLNAAQNQIKIVDFGLSNEWTTDSPLKTHCGSPEYAAPELFVTSKVYGPEVDLWSLGIIIYGMIVGQLPFVSTKSSSVSSQERRKMLVAQINKGMSSPQRKTIACYSFEFRSAVNRLLTADSKKRITIKEMIIHPWITENGKMIVRSNPTKKITAIVQNKIINDISAIANVEYAVIFKAISENPYGKIGGMYNILAHKVSSKCYTSNQVTRSLSDTSAFEVRGKKETDVEDPSKRMQIVPVIEEKRYRDTPRPHPITAPGCETSRTKTILTARDRQYLNHSASSSKAKENPYSKTKRPQTVQIGKINEAKENSAFRKRQEYSALIASSLNNQRNSKRIKYKKSDVENDAQATQKRRKESLKSATPRIISPKRSFSVGEKTNCKQTTKVSDSYLLEKTAITTKRKQSLEQTSNSKSSASASRSRKNSTAKNTAALATLMNFIDIHGDIMGNERPISRSSKRVSQKSETLGCSVLPNVSKKHTQLRMKQKTARPSTEGNKVTSKREK